jgi:hypothetical protein
MATPWENRQYFGLRHKVLKGGENPKSITALSHFGADIVLASFTPGSVNYTGGYSN